MTPHDRTAKPPASSSKRCERILCEQIKDEVYRQMFRLEASRPGAALALAIALLRAWTAVTSEIEIAELREWLKKISPICLLMIEAEEKASTLEQQCIQ